MHLPDGIISLEQGIVYWIITLIFIGLFLYKFSKDDEKEKRTVSTAIFSVFAIIVSSLSIPSPFGVPIHFFVIPIVAILLGPLTGSLVSFLSLIFQALFLGMGGVVSFGANFIVMGVILSFTTYGFYKLFKSISNNVAIFAGTLIGIMFATFGQIVILLISGAMNFESLLSTLLPFYLLVSVIEGFANVIIMTAIGKVRQDILEINKI